MAHRTGTAQTYASSIHLPAEGVPRTVRKAAEAVAAQRIKYREAAFAVKAARKHATESAPRAHKLAALRAAAQGQEAPQRTIMTDADAAHARAVDEAEAAEQLLWVRIDEFAAAVSEHRATWRETAIAAEQSAAERVKDLAAQLDDALEELELTRETRVVLDRWSDDPRSRYQSIAWGGVKAGRRRHQLGRVLDQIRGAADPSEDREAGRKVMSAAARATVKAGAAGW